MRRQMVELEHWIYDRLGSEWGGNTNPPGDHLGIELGANEAPAPTYVVQTSNDGFELWIGFHTQWFFHCRAVDARRIAWFVLWTWWARGTWFGARRTLWYWLLHRRLERHHVRMRHRAAVVEGADG